MITQGEIAVIHFSLTVDNSIDPELYQRMKATIPSIRERFALRSKPRVLGVATAVFFALQLPLAARTWTQASTGKTIEADFVKADRKQVHLRLKNSQIVQIPLVSLSHADQEFIKTKSPVPGTTASKLKAVTPFSEDVVTGVREWTNLKGEKEKGKFKSIVGSTVYLDLEESGGGTRRIDLEDHQWRLDDLRAVWHAQALQYSPSVFSNITTDPQQLRTVKVSTSRHRIKSSTPGNIVNTLTGEIVKKNVTRKRRGMDFTTYVDVPFSFSGELTLIWNNEVVQVMPVDFSVEREFHAALQNAQLELKSLSTHKDDDAMQISRIAGNVAELSKGFNTWKLDRSRLSESQQIVGQSWGCERAPFSITLFLGLRGRAAKVSELLKNGGSREASEDFRDLRDKISDILKTLNKACQDDVIWLTSIEPVFPTGPNDEKAQLVILGPGGQELVRAEVREDAVTSTIR